MAESHFLAFDLGASTGRAVAATLADGRLSLEEIRRFDNEPVEVGGTLYWNVLGLYHQVLEGMRTYAQRHGDSADALGVDTWGVDFGLLAPDGSLLQNPVHYRDRRTAGIAAAIKERMSPQALFQRTGMSLSTIETLCQLLAMRRAGSPVLAAAHRLLMMPDLIGYFLTGRQGVERTNAITSQLYDPFTHQWHAEMLQTFDLPRSLLPELIDPGTVLGRLREAVQRQTGLARPVVVAPCTHDTASAVAAVPAQGEDWAFLSSGTWSVVGALTDQPVTSSTAFAARLCNELTLGGFFLCRNIMGLWLLQQARTAWQRQGRTWSYDELVRLAGEAPSGGPLVDPDHPSFLSPPDMAEAIASYCRRTGQPVPEGPGAVTRCLLESLALSYRHALETLERTLGRRFTVLHVVGGGSQNRLLCQLTANATGLPVVAGPTEATVLGNVLVQALALRRVTSLAELRQIVRRSFPLQEYQPRPAGRWEDRYGRFRRLVEERPAVS